MIYQRAYCCFSALEEILMFNEVHTELYEILFNHSEIIVDLSDEKFIETIATNPFIKSLYKRTGKLNNLPDLFNEFEDQNFDIMSCDIFIVDKPTEECIEISRSKGVLVACSTHLENTKRYNKSFPEWSWKKGERKSIEKPDGKKYNGWGAIFKEIPTMPIPAYNGIIINDQYLFAEQDDNCLFENMKSIIEGLLPEDLKADFHVLLVFGDYKQNQQGVQQLKVTKKRIEEVIRKLYSWSASISNCKLKFGAVTMNVNTADDIFHNRLIIYNHGISKSNYGFLEFNEDKALRSNDIDINWSYKSIGTGFQGDMPIKKIFMYKSALKRLIQFNKARSSGDTHFLIQHYESRLLN
jgi:hypothetical protein